MTWKNRATCSPLNCSSFVQAVELQGKKAPPDDLEGLSSRVARFESNLRLCEKRQLFVENLWCLMHLKALDQNVRVLQYPC